MELRRGCLPILKTTVVPCTTQSVIRFPCGHAGPQQWPLTPSDSCWGTASSPYVSLTAQMGQSSMFSSESCGSAHIFCHVAVPSSSNPSTPVRDSGTRVRVCHGTRVRGIQAMRCLRVAEICDARVPRVRSGCIRGLCARCVGWCSCWTKWSPPYDPTKLIGIQRASNGCPLNTAAPRAQSKMPKLPVSDSEAPSKIVLGGCGR